MAINEVHERMLNEIPNTFDKTEGMWTYDVTKSVAVELGEQEDKTTNIVDKLNVENLEGEELDRFIYPRAGLIRKLATFGTTDVLITGQPGAVVNVGDLVSAGAIFFEVTQQTILDATGKAYVPVRCQISGTVGNVPSGAINSFPISLANITSVTNEQPITNGYVAESDNSYRQRYYDKLQRPGKAGNPYHYREWALSVPGVGKVKVYPRWNGPLTVKVVIVDSNGDLASEELVQKVFNYIETERPFGANVTVVSALGKIINISCDLTISDGYSINDIKQQINNRITEYFKSIAFESDYVSYAKIGSEILTVEGIVDYTNLLLNETTGNIELLSEEIPKIGVINV